MAGAGEDRTLLDPRALARLKGLTMRARAVVDGVLQGIHRSPHHGSSIEFAEHKEYSPGDEVRHIDWKAYGRLDKYYVKKFEQETNLRAWAVLDASASMAYGADGVLTKFEYASVLAAGLGFLLLRQQDAVGLVTFADQVQAVLPPRSRMGHLTPFCERLEQVVPGDTTRLEVGIRQLAEQARKRGFIFVFSDFFADSDEAFGLLRQLVSRGHQVTVFHILDGDELTFPFDEMTLFEGMETQRKLLVEPKLVRDRYLEKLAALQEDVRRRCLEARVEYALVDTREPPDRVLLRVLTEREAGRRKRAGAA